MFASFKTLAQIARKHAGFRRYAANTIWMFTEQMLRMVAGLLVGIWVARFLGPEQFGVFSYAVAFAALFSSIAKLGLDSIVVRDLVRNPELRDVYLGTAFWLKIMGAGLMLGAIALAMHFTSSDYTTKFFIFIIACGSVFQAFEVVDFYFQSKVLSKFASICKLTQLFVSSLLKLYLIYTGAGLFWFVVVSLVDQLTLAVTLYFSYLYQKIGLFFSHFEMRIAKKLLRDSWPLILSGFAIAIYTKIDQIIIKEMLGARELGIYSAAVRLSEVWYFVPTIITLSLFPSIYNTKKINNDMYEIRLQRLYTLLFWISTSIAVIVTLFSGYVVDILFGKAYSDAGIVLSIHIWTGIFVGLAVVKGQWQISENLTRHHLYGALVSVFFNVAFNFWLIPIFGVVGAAFANLISQLISAYLINYFFADLNIQIKYMHGALLMRGFKK
jgi:O-antigen/teichoic acid export membrane protein